VQFVRSMERGDVFSPGDVLPVLPAESRRFTGLTQCAGYLLLPLSARVRTCHMGVGACLFALLIATMLRCCAGDDDYERRHCLGMAGGIKHPVAWCTLHIAPPAPQTKSAPANIVGSS
jgi:hypothetical protein